MPSSSRALSFVKAKSRREAVTKMIEPDPILSLLYSEGENRDGKGGWINMIRDQHDQAYRLLFYLDRIPLSAACGDKEPYEVLYGEIDPNSDEVNFPRALYTTTGAVNLMRDGVPSEAFANLLVKGKFQIETFEGDRDIATKKLLERGCLYICIYDKEGEGLRILDLQDYHEIYFLASKNEIQVHSSEEVLVGETSLVRPFVLKIGTEKDEAGKLTQLEKAAIEANNLLKQYSDDKKRR